jgi:hypothetical protein
LLQLKLAQLLVLFALRLLGELFLALALRFLQPTKDKTI